MLDTKQVSDKKCTECGKYFPTSNFYCFILKSTGNKRYHSACKNCYKLRMRKWDKTAKEKNNGISRSVICRSKNLKAYAAHIINMARGRSRKKDIEFSIDVPWFLSALDNQQWKCEISGVKMNISAGTNKRLFDGISIDRIDNKKGYTPENCWLVCYSVNVFKSNASLKDVIEMSREISKRWPENDI